MDRKCEQCGSKLVPKVFPHSVEKRQKFEKRKYCSRPCVYAAAKAAVGDPVDFYHAHVDKTPGQGPEGDCWEWTGSKHGSGYGRIKVDGKYVVASRFGFNLSHPSEPLKEWEMACHTCDNPPCQRDEHLFRGTARANMEDAASKGRMKSHNRWTQRHLHVGESNW